VGQMKENLVMNEKMDVDCQKGEVKFLDVHQGESFVLTLVQ
jgi:hypothetical protein